MLIVDDDVRAGMSLHKALDNREAFAEQDMSRAGIVRDRTAEKNTAELARLERFLAGVSRG